MGLRVLTMSTTNPSFVARIGYAFVAFFRTLGSGPFAAIVRDGVPQLPETTEKPEPEAPAPVEKPVAPPVRVEKSSPDAAFQLLALFQREGRFIDFLHEPIRDFSDADVGAAARVVHDGCKKALDLHFTLGASHPGEEETRIEVPEGFDPALIRLTGNVVGEAPFHGTLAHRGWRIEKSDLPKLSEEHDATIIAPAEVEL